MFEQFAAVARTIGSAHRLELLELLAQTERSVEELAGLSGLTIANTSQHLQQLPPLWTRRVAQGREAGALQARRRRRSGTARRLAPGSPSATSALSKRCSIATFGNATALNPYRARNCAAHARRDCYGDRYPPSGRIRRSHLHGAINVPLHELKRRLREMPADQVIVAYCRGAYACSRTRRSPNSVGAASRLSGSKRAILNGELRAFRLSSQRLAECSKPLGCGAAIGSGTNLTMAVAPQRGTSPRAESQRSESRFSRTPPTPAAYLPRRLSRTNTRLRENHWSTPCRTLHETREPVDLRVLALETFRTDSLIGSSQK